MALSFHEYSVNIIGFKKRFARKSRQCTQMRVPFLKKQRALVREHFGYVLALCFAFINVHLKLYVCKNEKKKRGCLENGLQTRVHFCVKKQCALVRELLDVCWCQAFLFIDIHLAFIGF